MEEDYLVVQEKLNAAMDMRQPHILLQNSIKVSVDGNQWCILFGDNLQDGVAGFGDTPQEAAWDFDKNWTTSKIRK